MIEFSPEASFKFNQVKEILSGKIELAKRWENK